MNAKSRLTVKYAESVIEVNTIFAKMMQNPLSDEYALLQKVRADYPNFTMRVRQIKKNSAKETYPGLTYEYMRDYIILHTAPEDEPEAVAEFDELILISKCQAKGKRYPTIKKWFLAKYPEIVKFGMPALCAEESANETQAPQPAKLSA